MSVLLSVAEHYHHDASDFLDRFDILRDAQLTKTGRIKNFVDLLMGCECALKSHVFLSQLDASPALRYKKVRGASHSIDKLATMASYMADRKHYDFLKEHLQDVSVYIRYSLDAYETFFPFFEEYQYAKINHSSTIGNYTWVSEIRACLTSMLESSNHEFTGLVTPDFGTIIEHEKEIKEFMNAIGK